jgi:A/G-specific adenine glycosylase
MSFGEVIISWYHQHKRDLPWRNIKDPYKIWLSEIILQQTRVEQGLAYYQRFVKKYPDVKKLAAAKEDEVLKLWQGLGYYSRARNLHHAAKEIVRHYNGKFPKRYEDIRSLRGVGDYTAAAIASFAYNQPYPVVDGNVYRLLSRYLGITTPINSGKAKKEFLEAATVLMEEAAVNISSKQDCRVPTATAYSDFNQAIMEFGARQCRPANPLCGECPLSNSCFAFAKKQVKMLPVKIKKEKIRNRYFYYTVISNGETILLKKRTANDIWKNLYDFPLIEKSKRISSEKLFISEGWKEIFGNRSSSSVAIKESKTFTHLLSHQRIFAKFFEVKINSGIKIKDAKMIKPKNIHDYAVPKLIENYLKLRENGDL